MASPALFLLFFIFCLYITTLSFAAQNFFPVTKDPTTLQYVARIYHGYPTPRVPINLILDLGNPIIWIDCASVEAPTTMITSCSMKCSKGKSHEIENKRSGTCSVNSNCNLFARNGITGVAAPAELAEGVVSVDSFNGIPTTVPDFLFSCAPTFLLQSLSAGARGVLGLGKSAISLASQFSERPISTAQNRKFALCLSSSDGIVLLGNGNSISGSEYAGALLYTPLFFINQEYFINVQSIKINRKQLSIAKSRLSADRQGKGKTKLSTTVPYTTIESSIYVVISEGYAKAAASMNMTRVQGVAPFGLCFSSKELKGLVPEIELVLQSEMVKWRISGGNLMVRVSDEVMCLGFVDGGVEQESAIVIGGMQLEENFLEFDVEGSRLGMSSSLLMRGTSCSHLRTDYRGKESL